MSTVGTKVIYNYDDSDAPIVGAILWREDEDRVGVAWGDSQYADDPAREARIEYLDDLTSAPAFRN